MAAKILLCVVALLFLAAAMGRMARDPGKLVPAARTWLLVAAIFATVAAYLWLTGL
jgi:hypothetical protein